MHLAWEYPQLSARVARSELTNTTHGDSGFESGSELRRNFVMSNGIQQFRIAFVRQDLMVLGTSGTVKCSRTRSRTFDRFFVQSGFKPAHFEIENSQNGNDSQQALILFWIWRWREHRH